MTLWTRSVAWLAFGGLALGGCSAGTAASRDSTPANISEQQRQALADGVVTQDEYLAGFDAFAACLAEKGYPVARAGEYGRVLEFSIPAAAVSSGAERGCYGFYFELLDMRWQIANEDHSRQADRLRSCLIQVHGITPKPTLVEIIKQFEEINAKPEACPSR